MISITFSGKIVLAMHIVTIENITVPDSDAGKFQISLSNGLVLEEGYLNKEEAVGIAKKFQFLDAKPAN
jgi:hypothetical protein